MLFKAGGFEIGRRMSGPKELLGPKEVLLKGNQLFQSGHPGTK